jgi:hypothetical protein
VLPPPPLPLLLLLLIMIGLMALHLPTRITKITLKNVWVLFSWIFRS